jgi:hypothetical protein
MSDRTPSIAALFGFFYFLLLPDQFKELLTWVADGFAQRKLLAALRLVIAAIFSPNHLPITPVLLKLCFARAPRAGIA